MNAPINGNVSNGQSFTSPNTVDVTGVVVSPDGAGTFSMTMGGVELLRLDGPPKSVLFIPFQFRVPANTPITTLSGDIILLFKQGR